MNSSLLNKFITTKTGRIVQHVIYWITVFLLFDSVYAIKTNFWIAARNNLFYTPLHIIYYYLVAYWLIPLFLFRKQYLKFVLSMLGFMFIITLASRLVDIFIANPYILKNYPVDDWDMKDFAKRPFLYKITSLLYFTNALKAVNMVIWVALGIKFFKMWYERKQAALQAELNALKGQIHPHFLFNTLNNLYALTLNKSNEAPKVVLGLSDMLRYMLYECNTEEVPLTKEIMMLQYYVNLEKLRYEDRLDLTFNVQGDMDAKLIAPLLMLPFVENAFKHGVSEQIGQSWVNISVNVTDSGLRLKVSNSKAEALPHDTDKHYGHIGLQNVRKRLELLYPEDHQLKVMDDEDTFLIVLDLKLKTQVKKIENLVTA